MGPRRWREPPPTESLTGPLGAGGKSALIAMEIWRDDVNSKGGLLGRQVEFIYNDDQTNPARVPPIYTKLIDQDQVDLVVSSYGSNVIAPAMPIIMRKKMVFPSLFGLATAIITLMGEKLIEGQKTAKMSPKEAKAAAALAKAAAEANDEAEEEESYSFKPSKKAG